ncbi:uncharacterized protein SRS1_13259 [Sporisorium reilianum f. sp. reilianum]|uniref:Pentatricopeptide repeat-containing protein n=1 Tax=Sporisorium reilianum f. sp. reilianum TaxID=72559 RepID=A0A2N8UCH2_9BASI|nr:uncharacterized protein SRS1_13259 [Sporisorium reilianum f. sp. reilianum]
MTATCRSTLRTVAAAVSHASAHGPAARTRPQRIAVIDGRQLRRNSSLTNSPSLHAAATYTHPVAAQAEDAPPAEPVRLPESHSSGEEKKALLAKKHKREMQIQAMREAPVKKLLRLVAPESYSGDYREAHNLDQALSGVAEWSDATLAAPAAPKNELQSQLYESITRLRVGVDAFLAYRNAMLAESWPDARRHMVNIDDRRWPPLVLLRAINTVSTPSEISDALALLHASIKHARTLHPEAKLSSFKALRHCFLTLTRITILEDGPALHLLARSTDLLLALLKGFPTEPDLLVESINEFVRLCTRVPDERARQAVTRILDYLKGHKGSDAFDKARRNLVRACISSIESSMARPLGKTASSAQFVDFDLMDRLLLQDCTADPDLEQRALRCSIFVSGHACNHKRTWQSFDAFQEHKEKHGIAMTASDYQVLVKALLRSEPGRKEALTVLLQADELWRREAEGERCNTDPDSYQSWREERKLARTCLDLLQVMAKSPDVRVGQVFSTLGIFLSSTDYWDDKESVAGEAFSEVMLQRRLDARAYAVVMHGFLVRKRPKCALTVWRAMLQRGVMPNAATLSILLQNLFQMRNVRGAMEQLHLWCEQGVPAVTMRKPDRLKDVEVSSLSTSELPGIDTLLPSESRRPEDLHRVTPDVVLATVVFSGLHRCGSEGVESLWDAYKLTIQRFPDAPVLAMLLKASCPDEATLKIDATFGRQVFRSLLFRKHPELAEYRNPLNEQLETHTTAGWIFSDNTMGSRMEEWIGSVFRRKRTAFGGLPVDTGDPSSLVFTSKLFEHYLRLVLHLFHSSGSEAGARASRQELLDLLGWMKELHVTPSPTHVALTMLEIEEHLAPAVAARGMDALEAWVTGWLGEEALPEAAVMQRHWQWKVERNGQRKGWFDRVLRPSKEEDEDEGPEGEADRDDLR